MQNKSSNNDIENLAKKKAYKNGFITSLIIGLIIGVLILTYEINFLNLDFKTYYLMILSDSFAIGGGALIIFFAFVYISDEGAFDAVSYSVKLVFFHTFFNKTKDLHIPKNYAEYKALKGHREKGSYSYMLHVGLIYFVIAIILNILYRL